jgi:hypothetical protein
MADDLLVCPLGSGEGSFQIDLARVMRADSRHAEVGTVNTFKAPELMAAFNMAWIDASKAERLLRAQMKKAERSLDARRAVLLLEEVPKRLKAAGYDKSSEDLRRAVLSQDVEYAAIQERIDRLEAYAEMMKVHAKGFENSYTAVKKALGSDPRSPPVNDGRW